MKRRRRVAAEARARGAAASSWPRNEVAEVADWPCVEMAAWGWRRTGAGGGTHRGQKVRAALLPGRNACPARSSVSAASAGRGINKA